MIYEYKCHQCGKSEDIVKSVKEMDREEICSECSLAMERAFFPQKLQFMHTSVQSAEFNPAFGQVIHSRQERDELAKRRGMIEVGNETPEALQKHCDMNKPKRGYEDL